MTSDDRWRVLRQDDNGNIYVLARALAETDARDLAATFEARAHKQMYYVEYVAEGAADEPAGARLTSE